TFRLPTPTEGLAISPRGLHLLVLRDGSDRAWVSLFGQSVNLRHDGGNAVLQGHPLLGGHDRLGTQYLQTSHRLFHIPSLVICDRLLHLFSRRRAGGIGTRPWVGCGGRRFCLFHRG